MRSVEEDRQRRRTTLILRTLHGHRYGRVVVFETGQAVAPYLPGPHVAIVDFVGEREVDAFYVRRQDGGTGAEADIEKLWDCEIMGFVDVFLGVSSGHTLYRVRVSQCGFDGSSNVGPTVWSFLARFATVTVTISSRVSLPISA